MFTIDKCPWSQQLFIKIEEKLKHSVSYKTGKKIMNFLLNQPREKGTNFIHVPLIKIIAKEIKKDKRTISRYFKEWEERGCIKRHKGKANAIKIEILNYYPYQETTKLQKTEFANKIVSFLKEANLTLINEESE